MLQNMCDQLGQTVFARMQVDDQSPFMVVLACRAQHYPNAFAEPHITVLRAS